MNYTGYKCEVARQHAKIEGSQMDCQGHCLCEQHRVRYRPRNIRPARYVSPEHLGTVLYCGRCGRVGKKRLGGIVFGARSMDRRLVQFTNEASYWLSPEERQHSIVLTQ